jgi:hypothetical protein
MAKQRLGKSKKIENKNKSSHSNRQRTPLLGECKKENRLGRKNEPGTASVAHFINPNKTVSQFNAEESAKYQHIPKQKRRDNIVKHKSATSPKEIRGTRNNRETGKFIVLHISVLAGNRYKRVFTLNANTTRAQVTFLIVWHAWLVMLN